MKDPTWWQWALFIALVGSVYVLIGIGRGWWLRAIQITVIIAVVLSNAYWPWTESPYFPGLFGLGLAWLVTVFPIMLWEWPIFERPSPGNPRIRQAAPDQPKQRRRWGRLLGRSPPRPTVADPSTGVSGGKKRLSDGSGHGPA